MHFGATGDSMRYRFICIYKELAMSHLQMSRLLWANFKSQLTFMNSLFFLLFHLIYFFFSTIDHHMPITCSLILFMFVSNCLNAVHLEYSYKLGSQTSRIGEMSQMI